MAAAYDQDSAALPLQQLCHGAEEQAGEEQRGGGREGKGGMSAEKLNLLISLADENIKVRGKDNREIVSYLA
ncbi:hypothetical protein Nepgr_013346 [Nepenthes gracilis]|uniref:Uncharacterized protein n=1 Tax=Nepenthes gracilis TaxID=150966 RepID=A0AAD3XPA9_NEPGR|nr:hypothetical protein Nepgr_013346 [Nepenthes gracilis]